jgi:hypothetical protein
VPQGDGQQFIPVIGSVDGVSGGKSAQALCAAWSIFGYRITSADLH